MIPLLSAGKIALGSITNAKMRSTLTVLGIVIGVAAVIANVSLGASFNQHFTNEVTNIGSNFIYVQGMQPKLFYDNQLQIIENTPGILGVSPLKSQTAEVTYMSETKNIMVSGVGEDYDEVAKTQLSEGSFINDNDRYVAIIGYDIANEKFGRNLSVRSSIDITFRIGENDKVTQTFKVKGIIQNPQNTMVQGFNDNEAVLIPIAVMNEMLGETDYGGAFAMAEDPATIQNTSDEVDRRLARSFGISERDLEDKDSRPYMTINQAEILEQTDMMAAALSSFLTAVALISLLVGSIGIMNIMLVSVTERTREIGVLKSLGFTGSDILFLFMIESILLGVFGGIIGGIVGITGAYGVESFLSLPVVFPLSLIVAGFFVAVAVGFISGVYPARKAAKMKPVDSLRYE
ncbi:ABC transporter permease [Methanosarcina mazei]|jgi:putative ABC transport system permease protein|uniref:ABC transporter permease n=7 Tax=Methanosarcina mazei TaxID=2209 RepID=A0A0F8ISR5_METMZ|nr:ABC transporter permease [Methanosarcina mazei]AAM31329.1 ABC transporter, ATP-binding protein [Methanosarcina mazei Go1]AGF97061.1 ABC transporter, permease protein [Methanosarcina mazei Tuc01]AKB41949.1 ABC transporter, permease protein [Methanosarcina mazei WWM610]AKB62886.1 ABC transporter, permease protein [Methanosarcina mazei SarPi]AKB68647.1 ABC transporter, permease protein [Methanosarcina mazei LYC]